MLPCQHFRPEFAKKPARSKSGRIISIWGCCGCRAQKSVTGDYGCGKEVDRWLKKIEASLKPKPKPKKKPTKKWIPPSERRKITIAQLPAACRQVLESAGTQVAAEEVPVKKPVQATATAQK